MEEIDYNDMAENVLMSDGVHIVMTTKNEIVIHDDDEALFVNIGEYFANNELEHKLEDVNLMFFKEAIIDIIDLRGIRAISCR